MLLKEEEGNGGTGGVSPGVGSSAVPLRSVSSFESILTYPEAQRIVREQVKSKAYRAYPMGGEAGHYLRWKRGRLTPKSYTCYESILDKLARAFPDLEIQDFEPPVGVERLEEFLDERWGEAAPATYNQALSILKDFFKWAVLKGKLHGDPALPIHPHKKRDTHREFFNEDDLLRILAKGPDPDHLFRDRVALRLLLHYGLRKGALQAVQFKHFDHNRRRLTIFTKGEKVHTVPIPEEALWVDLGRHILDWAAEPSEYLLCRQKPMFRGYELEYPCNPIMVLHEYRDQKRSGNSLHNWWYECLERAGIVAEGVRSGRKMHMARHTAGQRVLDKTKGNLKAVQMLLGHKKISTAGDIYVSWEIDSLEETMRLVTGDQSLRKVGRARGGK